MQRLLDTLKEKKINMTYTPQAIDYLAEKGFDPLLGARPIKRAIQKLVTNRLSMLLIDDKLFAGYTVNMDCKNDELTFNLRK